MKRYGMRKPLQEFEKFLGMFWLCYAWKITLFERQQVCDFLRMYLTDRLSHRTTERRSRCRMPYLIQLRDIKKMYAEIKQHPTNLVKYKQ